MKRVPLHIKPAARTSVTAQREKEFFRDLAARIREVRRARQAERDAVESELRALQQRLARLDLWTRVLQEMHGLC